MINIAAAAVFEFALDKSAAARSRKVGFALGITNESIANNPFDRELPG